MIEETQKQVIFEEASKRGIQGSNLFSIGEIYSNILGVRDIGVARYGGPLASAYLAVPGEDIKVDRLANFFTGHIRDLKVGDLALFKIENDLALFNLEMWSRIQLLKNRSNELAKRARREREKAFNGSTWSFTDPLSTTAFIDMTNTTAWLDSSEGIAFIPSASEDRSIPPVDIKVLEVHKPEFCDFLGSNPKNAFDGLNITNWRCVFLQDKEYASAIVEIANPSRLSAISLDPVGFGIDVIVDVYSENKWIEVVKSITYSKHTYPVESKSKIEKVRVRFKSADGTLPKTVGLREVVLYTASTLLEANLVTNTFYPPEPFREIKLVYTGEIPQGSNIEAYFRTSLTGSYQLIKPGDWKYLSSSVAQSFRSLFLTQLQKSIDIDGDGISTSMGALYGIMPPLGGVASNLADGTLFVGIEQVEVSAFRSDWTETGDTIRILEPADFNRQNVLRTWSRFGKVDLNTDNLVAQPYGNTLVKNNSNYKRGGSRYGFSRRLSSSTFSSTISEYDQMVIVPLNGSVEESPGQYNYNYRMRFWVHAPRAFNYDNARYWLIQGYRKAGYRSYKDSGKAYGSFAMYINKTLVAAEVNPYTAFDDGTTDATALGRQFSYNIKPGWNLVEIYIDVINPEVYGDDDFDVANQPYLQLSLYPSLLDKDFRSHPDHEITYVVGSGARKPVSSFDLAWNLPKDFTYWAWHESRKVVLFNTNSIQSIDGYFKGELPNTQISFTSIPTAFVSGADSVNLKFTLKKGDDSLASPNLSEYTVMVR